jgi:hypothetical protein
LKIPEGEEEFEDNRGRRGGWRYKRKKSLKIPKGEEEFEDTRGRRRVWRTLLLPLVSSNSSSPSGIFKLVLPFTLEHPHLTS